MNDESFDKGSLDKEVIKDRLMFAQQQQKEEQQQEKEKH